MEKMVRKFVEGIYVNNLKSLQKALKSLLETPQGEDYVIIVLKEAIDGGHLLPCSKTAAIVSGIIAESTPHRDILMSVADGINDSIVCQDPDWLEDIIFGDTDIPKDSRQAFWDCIDRVQEVKRLFAGARYSTAVDDRCVPTPAEPDSESSSSDDDRCTPTHVSKSGPTIDELCDDEPEPASPEHYRPDPVPSDWKKDDSCTDPDDTSVSGDSDTPAAGAPPDANIDKWPEDDTGSYFLDDMGYVNYI